MSIGTSAGVVDPSCTGGYGSIAGPADEDARALDVAADGTILVAGFSMVSSSDSDPLVARFTQSCTADTSWNGTGLLIVDDAVESAALGVRELTGGKVQVAGIFPTFGGMRLTATGALDTTYDGDGVAESGRSTADLSTEDYLTALVRADGSVAGPVTDGALEAVALLDPAGSLDTTFGGGDGVATVTVTSPAIGFGVTQDPFERLLLLGVDQDIGFGKGTALVARVGGGTAVDDYDTGGGIDWDTTTTSLFGVCLDDIGAGTSPVWAVDADTCTASTADPWQSIPASAGASSQVATTTGTGVVGASVGLRFGMHAALDMEPGRYYAPIAITVVAPAV